MTAVAPTGLVFDDRFLNHNSGTRHPECPGRYTAIGDALRETGLLDGLPRIGARSATGDDVLLAHSLPYLRTVHDDIGAGRTTLSTGDTAIGPGSLETALLAVGGGLSAVDAVMQGIVSNAFVAARPPGHHATTSRGMGFCVFNNVAIAARYAQAKYGVDRVLIVDWDVHHGNGTQDIFYADPDVLFFSVHQWPLYPGTGAANETGEGKGEGATLNCPLPAGSGRAEILGAFHRKLLPAVASFKPSLVLISAGFDSRKGDPLGRFQLNDSDFADLTVLITEVATQYAGGRLVSFLEGGYSLEGLASASVAHVEALARRS